jgi:predicted CXXCH cytochrome family protein
MYRHGGEKAPHCTTCHEPHRAAELKDTIEDNNLCLRCHQEFRPSEALARHTGHGADPVANAGARCVECHMPRIVSHAGSVKLRSHVYERPDPKKDREAGRPNACLLCHADKESAWAEQAVARMWPR